MVYLNDDRIIHLLYEVIVLITSAKNYCLNMHALLLGGASCLTK